MHIMSRSNYLVIRYILHIDHTYTIIVSLCLFMQMQFPNVLIMISFELQNRAVLINWF